MKTIANENVVNIGNVGTVSSGITLTSMNAKKFVSRLKNTLKAEKIELKSTQCYEVLAKTFGASNWHELIKNLEKPVNSVADDTKHNKKLYTIFDLHWVEFKYLISDMCKNLGFNTLSTEIVLALLEIIKDRQYRETSSYLDPLLLDKLINDINLYDWLNDKGYPLKHYHKINTTLEKEIEKKIDKAFMKIFSNEQIQTNDIVKLIDMLKFINNTNFIVKEKNHNFQINEVVQIKRFVGSYTSQYPLISSIMEVSREIDIDFLSFHDILISLYLKKNRIRRKEENYELNIIKPIFENPEFCSYLFQQLKNTVQNKYYMTENLSGKIVNVELNYMLEFNMIMNEIKDIYRGNNESIIVVFKLNPIIDQQEKNSLKIVENFRGYIDRNIKLLRSHDEILDIISNYEVEILN